MLFAAGESFADPQASTAEAGPWCSIGGLATEIPPFSLHGLNVTLLGDPAPIPGARIRWRPVGTGKSPGPAWTEGTTDRQGRFVVNDLDSGPWEVEICAEGFRPIHGLVRLYPSSPPQVDVLHAIRKMPPAADRVRVLEPSFVVRLHVGTPVHVKWHVENGPRDPKGWEVRVSIAGCAEGAGRVVIYAEPFTKPEGGFTWLATKEIVDWMIAVTDSFRGDGVEAQYRDQGDLQLPVEVCLYNAAGRGETPGALHHVDDELLAMSESCNASVADPSWLFCGGTADDGGTGRLAPPLRRPEAARKR